MQGSSVSNLPERRAINRMSGVISRRLSSLPIPALIAGMAAIYFFVKPTVFFEPAWLLPITNTLFVTVVCLTVAYVAMRNYRATGRIQILLLGCGLLSFGLGGVIAAWVRSIPGAGANLNVTIYNTAALVGGMFHFAAAFILLAGVSPEVGSQRKQWWLVFSYAGIAGFIALYTAASLKGLIPPFFIQGVGPTALRQAILGSAVILFAFSFLIFMGWYLRKREVFLYWYSCGLALTAISLTGFFIQSAVGSALGWVGRFSQYLGGFYFLIAIVTAVRSAHARRTSFDSVITASLSPSEEKFRALAENSPDIIDRFDREMRHIYMNPAGIRLYGRPAASIIGNTIEENDRYPTLWRESVRSVLETGQPREVEGYMLTERGMEFYQSHCVPEYGADGAVENVLVLSRNLTERKHAEEEMNRRNRVLDGINVIFKETLQCETDEELGKTCLRVAEEITGSKFGFVGEIGADGLLHDLAISDMGWKLCAMYDPSGHRRPSGNFKISGLYGRVLQDGKGLLTNTPASHSDSVGVPTGHVQLTAFLGVPLRNGDRTIGMIAVGNRDGGYRREDQESLEALAPAIVEAFYRKRTERALIRSEKLASVGRLAATFAHEVNNPLAGAMNALYLAVNDESLSPQARSWTELAQRELRRAAQIARRTLGFYRESNHQAAVIVAELLKDLTAVYEPEVRNKNVQIRLRCADERAAVTGNAGEIGQLLSNLLANSIDAVGEAGVVHVRVARPSWMGDTRFLRITVADTGMGIERENLKRVFEPFFTTKKDVGTGLGLWICEEIVKKHGGTMRVRSRVGQGTVFCVRLPAAAAASPASFAATG
jgi:PAS domain S-box-containing protein